MRVGSVSGVESDLNGTPKLQPQLRKTITRTALPLGIKKNTPIQKITPIGATGKFVKLPAGTTLKPIKPEKIVKQSINDVRTFQPLRVHTAPSTLPIAQNSSSTSPGRRRLINTHQVLLENRNPPKTVQRVDTSNSLLQIPTSSDGYLLNGQRHDSAPPSSSQNGYRSNK